MAVKLTLRDKEYEVKSGMMLLDALRKCAIVPESVIATRNGETILDDEILKAGDEVKLTAVHLLQGIAEQTRSGSPRRQADVLPAVPRSA